MNSTGKIFLLIFLYFIDLNLNSQITVSAWVDKKSVPINESIALTVSISGASALNPKIDIGNINDFNIYSSGRSSNISIVNGQITSTVEFSYTLTPKRTGKFIIPKIGVFTGNEKYFTKEIEVEVTPPSFNNQSRGQIKQQTQPGRKTHTMTRDEMIFVKAFTDKKSAHPGEQINLTIKFYTAIPIASNPQYNPPNYSNLISEELPPPRTGTEVINGVQYYYAEVKTALFAIMPGKATISPATIIAYIQPKDDDFIDPFDPNFIQKFFSRATNAEEVKLQTKPIELSINPLPPPPPDFSNAVGNFFITAKTDQTSVNLGDAINLIVEITGKGNVKSINSPEFKSENFKVYDVLSSETISKTNDVIGGTKKFTYIISPTKEGDIKIEAIKFTFFNIDTKKYETIYTNPINIKVNKSKDGKTYDFDKTPQQLSEISKKQSDINYIYEKISPDFIFRLESLIDRYSTIINITAILVLLINYIITKRQESIESNPSDYAYKKALSNFKERIKKTKAQTDPKKKLTEIYDSIYDYISAKLKKNITHLTFSKLEIEIKNCKSDFSTEILSKLKDLIERIEFLNYASANLNNDEIENIIKDSINIIELMEKEFLK